MSCIKRHTLLKFLGLKNGVQVWHSNQRTTLTMIIESTFRSFELFIPVIKSADKSCHPFYGNFQDLTDGKIFRLKLQLPKPLAKCLD